MGTWRVALGEKEVDKSIGASACGKLATSYTCFMATQADLRLAKGRD